MYAVPKQYLYLCLHVYERTENNITPKDIHSIQFLSLQSEKKTIYPHEMLPIILGRFMNGKCGQNVLIFDKALDIVM